ncbi:hypothetical protein LEP1GSC062_1220 [Leptospira alexanderi serovar Manhao 3 str. L 60]|uniref:Uncharacterized protein n=1 Tax=Leptospira alexanderi serovar Manhao 3 str. L 60 TaxID=1049759 RepID=V6HXT3_9LEPT|nr:hypothetical protein LEP1GSC062_1220 [Leptospira alexanderi serovar Manhao 3 str. L 60]
MIPDSFLKRRKKDFGSFFGNHRISVQWYDICTKNADAFMRELTINTRRLIGE